MIVMNFIKQLAGKSSIPSLAKTPPICRFRPNPRALIREPGDEAILNSECIERYCTRVKIRGRVVLFLHASIVIKPQLVSAKIPAEIHLPTAVVTRRFPVRRNSSGPARLGVTTVHVYIVVYSIHVVPFNVLLLFKHERTNKA